MVVRPDLKHVRTDMFDFVCSFCKGADHRDCGHSGVGWESYNEREVNVEPVLDEDNGCQVGSDEGCNRCCDVVLIRELFRTYDEVVVPFLGGLIRGRSASWKCKRAKFRRLRGTEDGVLDSRYD